MNKNARKWIDALRSGKYNQTRDRLKDEYGHCCLGVACEVYQEEVGDLDEKLAHGIYCFDNCRSHLPIKVVNWLNLQFDDGEYKEGYLTTKNDTGSTFEEIADIIESEPEGLFRTYDT